jgi:DNA mismatch repair protein MutL
VAERLDHRATPVAQYRESYIIAQDEEGLVIVDQHAAHERVLFERYLAEAERNEVEVQKLLFPVTVELPPHEYLLVEKEAEELRRLGFLLEPFGGTTVRMDGVPAVTSGVDPESLLRELLGEAGRASSAASDVEALRRKLVTTAACRAAIKVNHALNRESMQALLDDLFATVSPSTCPHGRPLLFRLPLDELERAFDRR